MLAGDQQGLGNGGSYLLEIKGPAVANWPDLFAGEYVIRNHMSRENISIADFNFREIGIKNKARLVYEWNDCWKTNENIFLINKSIYLYLVDKGVQRYDSFLLWEKRHEGTFDFADYLLWLGDRTDHQIGWDDLSEYLAGTSACPLHLLDCWIDFRASKGTIPVGVQKIEAQLYCNNIVFVAKRRQTATNLKAR